jgi:hypothetical protein
LTNTVQITFDANDVDRLAEFWADALGYVLQPPPDGFDSWEAFLDERGIPEEERGQLAAIVDPAGVGPRILFQLVPEGKVAKNRVHLDVNTATRVRIVNLGSRRSTQRRRILKRRALPEAMSLWSTVRTGL